MKESFRKIEEKLNDIIDSELENDPTDCDVISQSVDALLRLEDFTKYEITQDEKDKRLNRLKLDSESGGKLKRLSKPIRVILIAALVAILITLTAIAYTGIKYTITHYMQYSQLQSDAVNTESEDSFVVGYVPDGFKLANSTNYKYSYFYEYKNASGELINIARYSYLNADLNTEYADEKSVIINDIEYLLYGDSIHGRGATVLYNNYTYIIQGNISEKHLIKIAQSIVENN